MASEDKQLDATPFGVPPSLRTWGGSGAVVDMAIRMYFLHQAFPDLVSPEYTLRAVNYILGHAPGIQHILCRRRRDGLEDEDVQQQSRDNAYIPAP